MDWYLSLIEGRDVIEELDPDGVLDLAGWDLKKALLLMGKGNCAFAEWLNSPFAYYKDMAFFESISTLKDEYFRKVSSVNHYYHMAMNHDKRDLEKRGCELKKESREHNTMIVEDSLIDYANKTAAEIESMFGSFPAEQQQDYRKLDEFFLNILNTFDI